MWPLLSRWFRLPRRHVYRDDQGALHAIDAQVGVDQGCPASSTLACLGATVLHEALSEHCFVAGLQDDTYLLMEQADIKKSLEAIGPALAKVGCQLDFRKSGVWSPGACDVGSSGLKRLASVPQVLKQPLAAHRGSGETSVAVFGDASVNAIVDSRNHLLDRVQSLRAAGLSRQHSTCLVRAALGGDSVYVQQCQPLRPDQQQTLDKASVDHLITILDIDVPENEELGCSAERWFLPWREGGFGFQAVRFSALANYVASYLRDIPGIAGRMQLTTGSALLERAHSIRNALQAAVNELAHLGASVPTDLRQALEESGNIKKLASVWRSQVVTRIVRTIESGATNDQITAMHESGGPGAGAWLNFPLKAAHHMSDQEFGTSVRLRMTLDVLRKEPHANLQCKHRSVRNGNVRVCAGLLDPKGKHALLCNIGGWVVRRHNRGRDVLAAVISERMQSSVHVEQHTPELVADDRHPDIDFYDAEQRHKYIDIEICTPHARALPGSAALHKPGALIETAEGVKRRKYAHLALIPAVMSHLGRFGTGCQTLFRMINRDADEAKRSLLIDECYQTLGCEIQKANVALLEAAGPLL